MESVLETDGLHCPSCVYAIEKAGRRIPGVTDVRVDAATGEIRVRHDGRPGAAEGVARLVERLGHTARVRDGAPNPPLTPPAEQHGT